MRLRTYRTRRGAERTVERLQRAYPNRDWRIFPMPYPGFFGWSIAYIEPGTRVVYLGCGKLPA